MIANNNMSELTALEIAINKFRRYNSAMLISAEENSVSQELMQQFFCAVEGSDEEKNLLMALAAAMALSVTRKPGIASDAKEAVYEYSLRQATQVLLAGKTDFLYETGHFGVGSEALEIYDKRQKQNEVAVKAANLEKVEKKIKGFPQKYSKSQIRKLIVNSVVGLVIINTGGTSTAAVAIANQLTYFLTDLLMDFAIDNMPKSWVDLMRNKTHEVHITVINTISAVSKRFENTDLGKKIISFKSEYEKGADKFKKAFEELREKCKHGKMWLKSKYIKHVLYEN